MIILDTDLPTLVQRKDSPEGLRIRARVAQAMPYENPVTTVINYEEQMRGWIAAIAKSKSAEQELKVYARLMQHIENYQKIRVVPFDPIALSQFHLLRSLKLAIGTMDLKIAAIALAHDALLLTRNLKDFQKIPNLRAEDWSKS